MMPSVVDINGPGEALAHALLAEKIIRYRDDDFQVCSGNYYFIMQLVQEDQRAILFYTQVPHIYPIPDNLKHTIQSNLQAILGRSIQLHCVNAGVEEQKKDILQSASFTMGDK